MKKILFSATIAILLSGIVFKELLWPGANILIILGSLGNVISAILSHGDGKAEGESNRPYILMTLVLVSTVIGTIFKVLHLPGSDILSEIVVISTVIAVVFLHRKSGMISFSFISSYFLAIITILSLISSSPFSTSKNDDQITSEQTNTNSAKPSKDTLANP